MRFATIKEIDQAGFDLRLWCFACARGKVIDGIIWARFEERRLPLDIAAATARFPCKACGSAANVLVLPATCEGRRNITGADFVAAYFHGLRSAAKKGRR